MPDCEYCDESFSTEEAYLDHLATAHEGELGRIDKRRVDSHRGTTTESDDDSQTLVLAGFVIVLGIAVVGILAFVLTTGSGEEGHVHEHGLITVTVDGDEYDFERPQYNAQEAPGFHFHGQGNIWHMHPNHLTLDEAMNELDVPITDTSIAIDGETYDNADPETSVDIVINGEPASLDHELQGTGVPEAIDGSGDHIQITVETPDGDGLDPAVTVE